MFSLYVFIRIFKRLFKLPFNFVNTRMRIKRDIGKWQLCTLLGGSPRNSRWGCAAGSLNPDPISDQNMSFSMHLYVLIVSCSFHF